MSPFTDLVRTFVQRRNLSVEKLAAMANISRKTLYRWVNGNVKKPRHWSQVIALGKALQLTEAETNRLLEAAHNPTVQELWEFAIYDYEKELLTAFSKQAPPKKTSPIPPPRQHYDPWPALEAPAGAVRPDSPFYIVRTADEQLRSQALGAGTTTTIQAGRQTGKTSLLMQALQTVRQADRPYVYLDFQVIEDDERATLDNLLRYMANAIAEQLDLETDPDTMWKSTRGAVHNFNRFIHREALPAVSAPILLAIDEADQLLDAPYKKNFFALLRAWDSRRAYDDAWRKLNLALIISTHPYLLIDDIHLSPFNVGLTITLQDFTPEQVTELNQRHGSPLTPAELPRLMEWVGGHPYLVRQALYTLVTERQSLDQLLQRAAHRDGPFGKHLRFYRHSLQRSPQLLQAMFHIVQAGKYPDETTLDRLTAVGLIKRTAGEWVPRCGLYQRYFREQQF